MLTIIQAVLLILGVIRFFVIAHFIMSWLLRFDVLNIRQEFVGLIWVALTCRQSSFWSASRFCASS